MTETLHRDIVQIARGFGSEQSITDWWYHNWA